MNRSDHIHKFVDVIWDWYARHKRSLPWRDLEIKNDTERAYRVLVSEVMLQQTQVSRVITTYKNFIQIFPSISGLADASNAEIIRTWRGMGYNSRALRLRDAAKYIASAGCFPRNMQELEAIPGIGHYTAAAIRNFAFNIPTPCLDTNIRRIIHRSFIGPENPDGTWRKDDKYLLDIAAELLECAVTLNHHRPAANWHAALMDYGSLVCTKRNPKWDICPLTKAGLMKAAYKVKLGVRKAKREPGRMVGSRFIPNRIFRGRVIEALRDASSGLPLVTIGRTITLDWDSQQHRKWLSSIMDQLCRDRLIVARKGKWRLSE